MIQKYIHKNIWKALLGFSLSVIVATGMAASCKHDGEKKEISNITDDMIDMAATLKGRGNIFLVELLKKLQADEKSADVKAKNTADKDFTALHYASSLGCEKLIKALLTRGADINAVGTNNVTPLMYAIHFKQYTAVSVLLKTPGIDINVADKKGRTALHYAVLNADWWCTKCLLENNNIDVNKKNIQGQTPLAIAEERQRMIIGKDEESSLEKIIEALENKGSTR